MPDLKIEYVAVEKLIPYAKNSRTHSDAQVAQIAASIREFGFTNPVLVDCDDGIIAGHGRVLAARKLEMDSVPCIRLPHLTDVQRRAYVIADNKMALNAEWDEELLKIELNSLVNEGFEVDVIGFSKEELKDIFADEKNLLEVDETLRHKEFVRCLISIPVDVAIEVKQAIDAIIGYDGVEVDYGNN